MGCDGATGLSLLPDGLAKGYAGGAEVCPPDADATVDGTEAWLVVLPGCALNENAGFENEKGVPEL